MKTKLYKHKLNMLEPGLVMTKVIGILFVSGFLLSLAGWQLPSVATFALAGVISIVLLVLLIIEAHQDKVLNEIAIRENKELEE